MSDGMGKAGRGEPSRRWSFSVADDERQVGRGDRLCFDAAYCLPCECGVLCTRQHEWTT